MKAQPEILIVDFGSQYTHLIARRVRDLGYPARTISPMRLAYAFAKGVPIKAVILSGGARSVYEKRAPTIDTAILHSKIPVLGICYGHQLIAHLLGGRVEKAKKGEYGATTMYLKRTSPLFKGVAKSSHVWMNHRDVVRRLPKGFTLLASSPAAPIAAYSNERRKIYSVQFHPEVTHTPAGNKILRNFLTLAVGAGKKHPLLPEPLVKEAKKTIGDKRAVVGLSGGVDSSVAAVLVSRAIGKKLLAVYVDTGLMRTGETKEIQGAFKKFPFRLRVVRASRLFFKALAGVVDPEEKRKIIGALFIKIFNKEARTFKARFLVQGTIYSDRIESGLTTLSSRIKSHHNVGGLPKHMYLKVHEPLRELYKDEVRMLAASVGLPRSIVQRKVFPGPGLAIRIVGEVTPKKVKIVRAADAIIQEELRRAKLLGDIWMAFPVLLSVRTVGIRGDARSYKYPIVLRIVKSRDAMSASFAKIPYQVLEDISTRITNEIADVNRVVYDISNKPPATMEWE